jgi:hypothetical protein
MVVQAVVIKQVVMVAVAVAVQALLEVQRYRAHLVMVGLD